MELRTNAGYTITDSITIGDTEFVLGVDKEAPDPYVTWQCSNGNYYFWGHYTSDLIAAKKDLLERAGDALERQIERQEKKSAEGLEHAGSTVIPLRSSLPQKCYAVVPDGDEIVIVTRGESGYSHTDKYGHDRAAAQEIVDGHNEREGVTKAQAAAMLARAMFGWDTPAADPKNYDDMGVMGKPARRGRDYER